MTSAQRTLAWCGLSVAALCTTYIAVLTLIAVDETRYAGVALEMWQRGDFLVPYNNGLPYSDKPPLLFWLMQAGWAVFGVNDWWPRVLVALCSLATAGATAALARRIWPQHRAIMRMAPMVLLGSLLWAVWTPAILFDVLLTLFCVLGVSGFALQATGGSRAGTGMVALALGLGVLSKGPVVLLHVLPVGLLAPLWHPGRPVWRWWYGRLTVALLGGAAVALAWAIPAAVSGGEAYAEAIFWGQSSGRMVESFAHAKPWWWYAAVLPLALFPWTGWLSAWRRVGALRPGGDWGLRFIAAWLLPALLGLSLISGKQVHYVLPLLPALALLLARGVEPCRDQPSAWWDASPVAGVLLAMAALTDWAPSVQASEGWPAWVAAIPEWTPVAFGLLGLLALAPMHRLRSRVTLLASVAVATVIVLVLGIARPAFPWYDLTPVALAVHQAQEQGKPVAHVGNYHNRLRFLGRLDHPVTVLNEQSLPGWVCRHPRGVVVRYYEHRADIPAAVPALVQQPFRSDWVRVVRARDVAAQRPCPRIGAGELRAASGD